MKKLLAITPHLSTGGGPQVLVKRIELIKDHYEIYVIEYSNISNNFIVQKNKIKNLISPDKFFTLDHDKNNIINLINSIKPDIIHMEEIPEMFMDYNIALKIYDKNRYYKIFETTHSSDFDVNNKIFFPDKFIFVSQYNCFKFNIFGIPTEVVEYPVDIKKRFQIEKEEAMKKLDMDPEYKHILNVGLFTPQKNQSYAFNIAEKLKDKKIKLHFVGNQADNFKNYWEPLLRNKPENCIIWGERNDVDIFYKACDLFLFTSIKELNPLVIKEALQEDIPIFLFSLDVYCGKYDDEKSCTYMIGNSKDDANLIKNFLFNKNVDSKKEIKKISYNPTIKIVDINGSIPINDNDIIYKNFDYNNYNNINIDKNNCLRPESIDSLEFNGLDKNDYIEYLNYYEIIDNEFNKNIDFLVILNKNFSLNKNSINIIKKSIKIMNDNDIQILSMGGMKDSIISNEKKTIDNIDFMCLVDNIDNTDCVILSPKSKNILHNKNKKWDNKNYWFNYIFDKKAMTYDSYINKINNNIKIKYDKKNNKISFKYNEKYEKLFKIKFMNNDNILYETSYKISNEYYSWSILNKIKKLEFITINFYDKNDEFLFSKKLEINKKIKKKYNKDIYVISTYPNTEIKNKITEECINIIKNNDGDVILSSHMPLDANLQKKSDFYIYDKYNPLIEHNLYNNYYFENNDFRIDINLDKLSKPKLNKTLTILNNIQNSVKFAKEMGYKRIINVAYDYLFTKKDINTIKNICSRIDNMDAKGFFMESDFYGLKIYKNKFFIIDIDLFLEVFNNIKTPKEFNKECKYLEIDNSIGRYFYKKLSNKKNKLIIENTTEENLFNGEINIFSEIEYLTIVPVVNNNDSFILWLNTNNKIDNRKIIIDFYNNNNKYDTFKHNIENEIIFYKEIKIKDNDNIEIKITYLDNENSNVLNTDYFGIINKSNIKEILKNRGQFKYKNNKTDNITSIINFNYMNDFNKIEQVIDALKPFSNKIKVCYHDGGKNLNNNFEKLNEIDKKNDIDFIEYEYDNNMNNNDKNYWDNISRTIGVKYSEDISEWILFVNSNENIINSNFNLWFNNKIEGDAYLFGEKDSPLLIRKNVLNLVGDRFDIINNSKGNKYLNIEENFKIKLYKKI